MSTPFEMQPIYRYTLPPGLTSLVRVRTLPNARCTVRADADGLSPSLLAYADPDGFVELHVRPSGEHESPARVTVEADAEGETAQHVLELRPSREPTEQMPSPPAAGVRWRPPAGAQVRPALSLDESLGLADDELLQRGYPPRPDAELAPSAFNTWRRTVSAPITFVEPRTVSRPDITHAGRATVSNPPESAPNWSGFELRGAAGTYDWVTGEWVVPSVTGESNSTTYSSFWIGLDGDGTTDLVQAGTEQENVNFSFFGISWSFSTYYAWTQFLPQQQTEQQVTNFSVHPGDEIFCQVFVADAGQMPSLTGFFGQFVIMNQTTSTTTWSYTPRGTTNVGGSEAEWIMERPTVNGGLADLADYGSARMSNAVARKVAGGYVGYQGATNEQITMFNGNDILSTVSAIDAVTMQFKWQAFH
jgi:Peptidase A4 family